MEKRWPDREENDKAQGISRAIRGLWKTRSEVKSKVMNAVKSRSFHRLAALLFASLCLWAFALPGAAATRFSGKRPPEQALYLQPILVPPAGSAAFYITDITNEESASSGIFRYFGVPDEVRSILSSVRVHYTVLSFEGNSARLLVRAQPVDPWSGQPIAPLRWEATYVVDPEGAEFESGDEVPQPYHDIVVPHWLGDWTQYAPEQRPAGPLLPGAEWTVPADFDWEQFAVEPADAPVTSTFTGWVDAGRFGAAAHIHETVETTASGIAQIVPDEGISSDNTMEVAWIADQWLLPGDFPYGGEMWAYLALHMVTRPDAPAWAAGELLSVYEGTQSISRDDNEEPWLPYEDREVIEVGESVAGILGPWSERIGETPFKKYAFYGNAGDIVDIYLESAYFDPYVWLYDEADNVLDTDDDSGGGTNAYIRYRLPYTGVYYVYALPWHLPEEYGLYTLTLLPH